MYAPPRPPWYTNTKIALPICLVAVVAVAFALLVVVFKFDNAPTGTLHTDPATHFDNVPAIDLSYTYIAPDGTESAGQLTITEEGYATGSVIDQFAGVATVHTTPEGSAVWADEDWWSRRAPSYASQVKNQWIQLDPGTALPIDLAAEFNPSSLPEVIRTINDDGVLDPDLTSYQGIPAVALNLQDWTLIRSSSAPIEVMALFGPIDTDLFQFQTASAHTTDVPAVQVPWDGHQAEIEIELTQAAGGTALGTIAIAPHPASPETAKATKDASTDTLNGHNTDPDATNTPVETQPPPPLSDFPLVAPELIATINAKDCFTDTCTWTATIRNIGNGPGEASVTASATPGMSAVTESLGIIQPGGEASTSIMSFTNPAPKPAPGQTTSITINYTVVTYAPQIGGSNAPRYRDLVDRLGGYQAQPALDRVLRPLAMPAKDIAVEAMHSMLDDDVSVDDVLDAIVQATQANPAQAKYADTPLLRRLTDAGDRFTSWAVLAEHLSSPDPTRYAAYVPGLQSAATELGNAAAPTVGLTYLPSDEIASLDAVIISDYPDTEAMHCTGVIVVPGTDLATSINQAVTNANQQAENCTVHARLVIPDTNRDLWAAGRPEMQTRLQPAVSILCESGEPAFENLTVITGAGNYTWTLTSLCTSTTSLTEQQKVERLNSLNLPDSVIKELVADQHITVGTNNEITAINWRNPARACRPAYTNGGASHEPTSGNRDYYLDGYKAVFSAGYLCKPLRDGGKADYNPLWNWPKPKNPLASEGGFSVFQRCHLVARQLGGAGTDPGNLVTCFWRTNLIMKEIESPTKRRVTQGEHIFYFSMPQYNGINGELSGIRVIAIGNQGFFRDECYTNEFYDPTSVPDASC
ncbi:hypothetical protein [Natronoglycomyces albus]|uniref:DNA/RNA non-specific endonuclease n=1 Tax=Natronoglycomyces albus TaxID=2811108 RepID=A0A895XVV7_9ACTN|nr:hypothetical protein [Natronoglycomyces albus]QSB06666.1 hypothetical protein JQS30_07160 [Natronoglycomyces albus]